ncbi:MAG: metallophosphoesterase [Elusimicrobia bacterium]|nr:metallophosphoesterase [Elusimicrobiota bacterium]
MKESLSLLLSVLLWAGAQAAWSAERDYVRLVVFSDTHLPGRLIPEKRKAVDTVNAWDDVDGVAVTGDIAQGRGTPEEFAFAKDFFSRLKKPLYPITGNHDFIYDQGPDGKTRKAPPEVRQAKLESFRKLFGLPGLRYSRKFGRYLCLFVSADDLDSPFLAAMSSGTVAWLDAELGRDPDAPAIVFFHAPLEGTIESRNEVTGVPSFVAQPAPGLRELLRRHPKVFLWVSGHTHIGAVNPRFADAKINLYDGRVHQVHSSDMDGRSYLSADDVTTTTHDTIWTNSLYLYPDKVVVKTYDHKQGKWLEGLTREFRP